MVLAISVISCLTACSGNNTAATEKAPATVDEAAKMSYEVTVGREERYEYDDGLGNHFDITIAIPEVRMDSEGAKSVNTKINKNYERLFDDMDRNREEGLSPTIGMIEYDHSEARGILSVWIDSKYDGGSEKISAYSLDLSDGSEMNSNKSILTKLGLDKDEVKDDLIRAVTDYFNDTYGDLKEASNGMFDEKLKESLSDDFISSAVYFVRDDHLWARVTIAQIAGSYGSEKMVEVCEI